MDSTAVAQMVASVSAMMERWQIEVGEKVVFIRSRTASDIQPTDWKDRLSAFVATTGVACAGAKRLAGNAQKHIFSMGEFVIHPKGFHGHGAETNFRCYRFPEEVDVIAGGVMAVDRKVLDQVGGSLLMQVELGGVRLGLALRKAGYRCVVLPQVVTTDAHAVTPSSDESEKFRKEWGFDWNAADLDEVRRRYAGTGLLWNVRFHAGAMPFDRYEYRPAPVWKSYADADYFRKRAHYLCDEVVKLAGGRTKTGASEVLELGCGDGLFTHLMALRGAAVTGVDPEPLGIEQAQQQTANQSYPGPRPVFLVGDGSKLPFEAGQFAAAAMFDVIEHLDNPVRVLRELGRVVQQGGHAMVVTPMWQYGGWSDSMYHATEYTMTQLVNQINATGVWKVVQQATITGVYRDAVVTAKRL